MKAKILGVNVAFLDGSGKKSYGLHALVNDGVKTTQVILQKSDLLERQQTVCQVFRVTPDELKTYLKRIEELETSNSRLHIPDYLKN